MNSMDKKPPIAQQDPAEGSREVIERELRRKGLQDGAESSGEDQRSPDDKTRTPQQPKSPG